MGSRPWKFSLWCQLSPEWEGRVLTARGLAGGREVTGVYTGLSSRGSKQWLDFSTAPEGMTPANPSYWDHSEQVPLERGLKLYHDGELIAEAPPLTRRMTPR